MLSVRVRADRQVWPDYAAFRFAHSISSHLLKSDRRGGAGLKSAFSAEKLAWRSYVSVDLRVGS